MQHPKMFNRINSVPFQKSEMTAPWFPEYPFLPLLCHIKACLSLVDSDGEVIPEKDNRNKNSNFGTPENYCSQGSKLTVASSKLATYKSHLILPPVKHVGSKKLLPGNSVMEVIFRNSKLLLTEKFLRL